MRSQEITDDESQILPSVETAGVPMQRKESSCTREHPFVHVQSVYVEPERYPAARKPDDRQGSSQ